MGLLADEVGDLLDLVGAQVLAGGDVEQHAARAGDGDVLQQRAGDGLERGLAGAVLAAGDARAHEGQTGIGHDGLHVREVEVDQAVDGDEVGDALDREVEDLVGLFQHDAEAGLLGGHLQQAVVGNGDDGVHDLAHLVDTLFGLLHAAAALEVEGFGHHGHGERAGLLGGLGDDRRGAGARAAAHAGGDEDHVGALQQLADLVDAFQGGVAAHLRVGARAQPLGEFGSQLDGVVGERFLNVLGVGVRGDEAHAGQARLDHVVDGVSAAASAADDFDFRAHIILKFEMCHGFPPPVALAESAEIFPLIETPVRRCRRTISSCGRESG